MALTDYSSIRTSLFVKWYVEEYWDNSVGLTTATTLRYSDHGNEYDLLGETYTALGDLVSITSTTRGLASTDDSVTITIAGIPDLSRKEILNSRLLGSSIEIRRAWFDSATNELISDGTTDNPVLRFKGYVSNWNLEEDWDAQARMSTNTINIECSSWINLLSQKTSGRRTNPTSMKKHYPSDTSFDRVYRVANTNFDFGKT